MRSRKEGRILNFLVKGLQMQRILVVSDPLSSVLVSDSLTGVATHSSPPEAATGTVNWGGRNEKSNL